MCSFVVSGPQGVKLPIVQAKFENFMKNGLNIADTKVQYKFTFFVLKYL